MLPSIFICFLCMFVKTFVANEKIINFGFLFIGVIVGLILLIVYEFLYAISFPKNATVYIGVMPKNFAVVALSSCPIKRNRFIFLSILPIVLGVIPLVIFCLGNSNAKEINGFMFGMAVMEMASVYPDIYNIFNILKVVPKNTTIQNNKNETYYFE